MRTLLLTGDLILDEPDPDHWFSHVAPVLRAADLAIGHVEVPFTLRTDGGAPNPNPGRDPAKLGALARAGIGVATLAANHAADQGRAGVEDTLAGLRAAGIQPAGVGLDLAAARRPALARVGDLRVGVLSFNCVGPPSSWASERGAGCAYVDVSAPDTLRAMCDDVARTRAAADLLVVALHKGLVHTPAVLEPYERPLAHAAVDAGADVVVSHHAHILRGVEVYRDRPIFHGLGNLVTVTRVLNLEGNPNPEMLDWARRRRELFGFEPDPSMPVYPFHPESRNTMIAACAFDRGGVRRAGFVPCWIDADGRPRPLALGPAASGVVAYVDRITRRAGLAADLRWRDGLVAFL
jgi:Bacterial capsule synthesis protein PGA_cap